MFSTRRSGVCLSDWRRRGFYPYSSWLMSQGISPGDYSAMRDLIDQGASQAEVEAHLAAVPEDAFAYHFDARRLAAFLRAKAEERGVRRIEGVVRGFSQDERGTLLAAMTDTGEVAADFFIDASGFAGLIHRKLLEVPWDSFSDSLLLDRAIPFFLPLQGGHPPLVTVSRAMKSGWMWTIPTQGRLGCGYVYSSAFADEQQVLAELREVLGREPDPIANLRFTPGRLRTCLERNALAVGLSSGFVEPLEATSIRQTIYQLMLFGAIVAESDGLVPHRVVEVFNEEVVRGWYSIQDFLILHYDGARDDTPFWKAARNAARPARYPGASGALQARLQRPGCVSANFALTQHLREVARATWQAGAPMSESSYTMRRIFRVVTPTMISPGTPPSFDFPQFTKVVMVLDVVESVKLMEQDERGFIQRWHNFVEHAEREVLPRFHGRLHKSLGDGLMLEFEEPRDSVQAAFALQEWFQDLNEALPPGEHMRLRVGAHLAEFVADEYDIYGTDVNLTARVATLAGPGEVVVTAQLNDRLTAGLDAQVEDLGDCYLKHVKEPIRAYRIGHAGPAPVLSPAAESADLRPTLAVIPFEARSHEPDHFVIGELLADGIISQLAHSPDIRVVSRLSSTAFRGRPGAVSQARHHLGAGFVLSGSYVASGAQLLVMGELASALTGEVLWADRVSGEVHDLLRAQSEVVDRLARAVARALIDEEVRQSLTQPMPRLDSSKLLMGGISMMHRSSLEQFERSREALTALVERHNRIASPRAWLAKWHLMRIVRGLSDSPATDARLALEQTHRALDLEPDHALTLAVEGHAYCQLVGDFAAAGRSLDRAIAANPNEPLAWLFKSVLTTMSGDQIAGAVSEAEFAAALSPLDPLRYYFDSLLAAAHLSNHSYEEAIQAANASLRANRHHAPTLRVLVTAQQEAGRVDEARASLRLLMAESPGLTVSAYLSMGSALSSTRQRCAAALRALGVAEH